MSTMSTGLSDEERRSVRTARSGPRDLEPLTITIRDAQRLSGLSRTTLHRLAVRGHLRTVKVLKRTLVDYASFKLLLTPTETVS